MRDGGTHDVDTDDGKDVVARLFFHPFRPLGNEWLDGLGIGLAGGWGAWTSSRRPRSAPPRPFAPGKGSWGAFEIAARYHSIDFDDDSFPIYADPDASATEAEGWTVGLNWYLNRWIKLAVNYDQTSFDGGAAGGADRDTEDTILTRLQLSY